MHPEIPEGINVSKTHPLADFGLMLVGAVGIVIIIFIAAQLLAGVLVRFISFETETRLFQNSSFASLIEGTSDFPEKTAYIQNLADQLSARMDLPEGMQITAHYSDEDVPNAFATLGGNILIYQGLIDEVSSENGLAMVVAHEIAHIKNRDPIMSLGRGVVSMIGIIALTGFSDSSVMGNIAGFTGAGVLSKFSRDQESYADEEAVSAVMALYGTLEGADDFFAAMLDESSSINPIFFQTHPPTQARIERINSGSQDTSRDRNIALTPLPDFLTADVAVDAE